MNDDRPEGASTEIIRRLDPKCYLTIIFAECLIIIIIIILIGPLVLIFVEPRAPGTVSLDS